MEDKLLKDVALALKSDWSLEYPNLISEETILKLLAERVAQLTTEGQEAFYQLMYRLDISEKKLIEAAGTNEVAEKIARLIYNRQLEKVKSRNKYKQNSNNIDPDLKW